MKFVVDTNICFSFFKKGSFTEKLIVSSEFTLFAPSFVFEELDKYKETIIKKSKITAKEYAVKKKELQNYITFVKEEEYLSQIKKALVISPDENDFDFFALALHKKIPLWTNDNKLKEQDEIRVFSTADIVEEYL
jgi:predicted nucleic acid-binding protein